MIGKAKPLPQMNADKRRLRKTFTTETRRHGEKAGALESSGADSSGLTDALPRFHAALMFGSRNGMSLCWRSESQPFAESAKGWKQAQCCEFDKSGKKTGRAPKSVQSGTV